MRIVNILLLFIMLIGCMNAQIGVRVSTNIASFNISAELQEGEELGYKIGFGVGVFYNVALDEDLSFQPEINYVQQGAKLNTGGLHDLFLNSAYNLNYIQIPILAKYRFEGSKRLSFFAEGGPYLGLGMNGENENCFNDVCDHNEISFGNADNDFFKNPDFGIQLGGGIIINSKFSFDIRYVYGIQNLIIKAESGQFTRNTALNVGLGYSF